ncbi:hypothetical protein AN958_04539 [Leucoagaricus sp. SymC.cos]|nr:hypothetical protein AN958_04539 [Leucoagaricus sp. SymC.cos]
MQQTQTTLAYRGNGKSIFDEQAPVAGRLNSLSSPSRCVLEGCGGIHIVEAGRRSAAPQKEDPDGKWLHIRVANRKLETGASRHRNPIVHSQVALAHSQTPPS